MNKRLVYLWNRIVREVDAGKWRAHNTFGAVRWSTQYD